MLQASNLTLWRGSTCLFERLSFRVEPSTALIVRGPNGAGKTTLLRVLCGLTRTEEGEVLWQGRPAVEELRGKVAYAGHQPGLKADLTVRQNLAFYAGLSDQDADLDGLMRAVRLGHCADLEVRHLSAGQKRRAGLARVFIGDAPLWLLDEPFTNLDPEGRALIEEKIEAHLAAGGLAVVVAHGDFSLRTGRIATLELRGY
jgi:heme exporter protein A